MIGFICHVGHHTSAPSDSIWSALDTNGRLTNGGLTVNGSLVDGMNTFVDMAGAGAQNMMGVIQGAANLVRFETFFIKMRLYFKSTLFVNYKFL